MRVMHVVSIFSVVLILTSATKWIPSYAGPYRPIPIHMGTSVGDEYGKHSGKITGKMRFTHPKGKEPQYVWGSFNFSVPYTNRNKVEIRISRWANNEWKKNFFVMKFSNACNAAISHATFLTKVVFGDDGTKCPLPVDVGKHLLVKRGRVLVFACSEVKPNQCSGETTV